MAKRVREERKRLDWTQADLAKRLTELGHDTNQPTVARLESGKRPVPIDELFALAAALDVPPVYLLTPREDEAQVAVTRKVIVPASLARAWLRGTAALPGTRYATWTASMPDSELRGMIEPLIRRRMTKGMNEDAPLAVRLAIEHEIDQQTEQLISELRTPKEETDG